MFYGGNLNQGQQIGGAAGGYFGSWSGSNAAGSQQPVQQQNPPARQTASGQQ